MSFARKISRRQMLGRAVGATAATMALPQCPLFVPASAFGANDQIGVGVIGCGRRNGQLVIGKGGQGAPPAHARIVAVADLNLKRAAEWAKNYRCQAYQDYRALLDRKEVARVLDVQKQRRVSSLATHLTEKLRIGWLLLQGRLISTRQLTEALETQKKNGRFLGEILVGRPCCLTKGFLMGTGFH